MSASPSNRRDEEEQKQCHKYPNADEFKGVFGVIGSKGVRKLPQKSSTNGSLDNIAQKGYVFDDSTPSG
jgi:hypothetical protein